MDSIKFKTSKEVYFFKQELGEHLYVYIFIVSVFLITAVFSMFAESDVSMRYDAMIYIDVMPPIAFFFFSVWLVILYFNMVSNEISNPLAHMGLELKFLFFPLSKSIFLLLNILLFSLYLSSYSYWKSIIPDLIGFRYDGVFYELDKFIHFGRSPWEITHYIFTGSLSTLVINILYNFWFFIVSGLLFFFIIYRKKSNLRFQFFLTFLFCWLVLGNVAATLLSSAGPCFSHLIDPTQMHYQPLLERLYQQSAELVQMGYPKIWALDTQNHLWSKYINRSQGIGVGISAMPSMHVSMAVLFALSLSALHRRLGYIAWIYALAIQVGSVHLAWHYAIDGYVSAAITITIWYLCGKISRRCFPTV